MCNRFKLHQIGLSVLLITSSIAQAGEFCGSKIGYLNQLTSEFLIPENFPPESELLKNLVSRTDRERCEKLSPVYLGESCRQHDLCYIEQLGKESCDSALQDSWVKDCRQSYRSLSIDSYVCRLACESFVKLMSQAERFDSNGYCPSCDSYNSPNN